MFHSRLQTRLFLWLLGAMTVIAVATSGVLFLLSDGSFEEATERWVLPEVRLGRDLAENLLRSGRDLEEIKRVLAPIAESKELTLAIVDGAGRRVLLLGGPGPEGEGVLPTAAQRRAALEREGFVTFPGHRRVAAGVPIRLPSGERGVFFVTVHRVSWERHGHSFRLLAALAVILGVGWLLSWPIARRLARPLNEMAATADALGKGDLAARIPPRRRQHGRGKRRHPDEMDTLAESFNTMAANLQRMVVGHKQLLADISHELRSPLARLKVALELARGRRRPKGRDDLERAEAQADAIEALIEELLMYSRLETAPYELHVEAVPPREVLAEAAALLESERKARRVALDVAVKGAPAPLRADRRLLARALGNALQNAIAHAPRGSTVRLGYEVKAGQAAFSVSDAGPGVAAAMQERIFEPFVRTDAARSRTTGGVGLGLAIARRCMEAHGGGASSAANPRGKGLTLRLWLPAGEDGP